MEAIKLHPAIVHFPIALLLLAGLFGSISLFVKREFLKDLMLKCFFIGLIFAPIAVITGILEEQNLKHDEAIHEILVKHKFNGFLLTFFFLVLAIWFWFRKQLIGNTEYPLWIICLLVGSALVLYQGYTGGEMVFEKGAGVKPMEPFFKTEEESGSGHHHSEHNESKNNMNNSPKKDTMKMENETKQKMNMMNSHTNKKKDSLKKKKELKGMKY